MRNLKFMWKDGDSVNGDCPALFEVEGGHIVVGTVLSADDLAEVNALGAQHSSRIGAGETAVFVPANVLNRLRGIA